MTGTYWCTSYLILLLLGVAALAGLVWWLLRKWHDRIDSEAYDRGYKQGKMAGQAEGYSLGKTEGQAQERARQAEAEAAQRRSPWARDIPMAKQFEVAQVPYETVTLRAELVLDEKELQTETKTDLLNRLCGELLKEAREYVELERYDNAPWLMGSVFRATLRVLKRQDQRD